MECIEGTEQELSTKPIAKRDSQQLQDQLQNICLGMKQGIGKVGRTSGGDSDDDKDTENVGGQRDDKNIGLNKVCFEELCDLDVTITNENISDYVMNQLKEKPFNVSGIDRDQKHVLKDLNGTEHSFKSGAKDSEPKTESVNSTNYSHKLDSIDLTDLVTMEELVVSDKEMDMYLFDNDDTETLHNEGNEAEENTVDILNSTVIVNVDFRAIERNSKIPGDGSDSGVEVSGCTLHGGRESSPALLRAFSSNSGGYTSSCGGLEDSLTASTATPAASCDSSLISCYSAYEETEDIVTNTTTVMPADGDGTSEGGSESSSLGSKDIRRGNPKNSSTRRITPGANKRTPTSDVAKSNGSSVISKTKSVSQVSTPVNFSRPKSTASHRQTPVTSKAPSSKVGTSAVNKPSATNISSHKREKVPTTMTASCGAIKSSSHRSTTSECSAKSSFMSKSLCGSVVGGIKIRSKDSSLSIGSEGMRDTASVSTPGTAKGKGARNTCNIRNKVVGGTDDGRWPSSASKSHSLTPRSHGNTVDGQPRKLNVSGLSSVVSNLFMESKATALEKYATLPRRRRCKSPEVQTTFETAVRSHSVSRDPSLNRAASLRKQHHQREGINLNKSLPPYPRRRYHGRTVIYHETGSQTALTASDVENALAGVSVKEPRSLDAIKTQDQEVQVDQRMEEVERLEFQLRLLTEDHNRLKADSVRKTEELSTKEQQLEEEKAEKLTARGKLDLHSQRVLAMLRNAKGDHLDDSDDVDCMQALDAYLQSSSSVVFKQQQEINDLQTLCRTLKRDLEKSLAAQKTLLQQQQEIEVESIELQEFLQAEKSTLADALRDAETEIKVQRQQMTQKECELERQQEECKHLVRISEQRRQENLVLQAQLCSLEQRSRELLLQQGAAVSGAAVALSGLSSRLDGLVEQLVVSYNISEKDLEDVIFHNEAYSKSNSSVEASPERMSVNRPSEQPTFGAQRTPSPKRGASFVSAVISAIRNAAVGGAGKRAGLQNEETAQEVPQDAYEEMSKVEEHEKDLNKTEEQDSEETELNHRCSNGSISSTRLANSESLQNLSQAILNRQHFEMAQADGSCCRVDLTAIDYGVSGMEVLPPLEDCFPAITLVDQIIDVDNLVTKLLKVLRIIQLENDTCVDELHDERVQLAEQVRREQESRREVQEELKNWERIGARLRGEVQDVHLQLQRRVQELENTKDELQQHRDQIEQLTRELQNLSTVCKQTEQQLCSQEQEAENVLQQWQESGQLPSPELLARVVTTRDKTLHSIQGVVMQCPSLMKLQQALEETNFQCASSLPLIAADLNANAPPLVTLNGTHSGGNSALEKKHKSGNTINGTA
ncbi:uncharacterized protein LOC110829379 isoform X2 [Zootermopsis nevadensis]|uniref:uncharacterized protein LOC110829379 isoform X2 n=1 Tax=Zootermopsis nevadensis TaxID=136037 RepID=UPI000B8E3B91|nr:uncharacterized protein LOC110829379 isoform X2 [Zootermopsis nevadensis]